MRKTLIVLAATAALCMASVGDAMAESRGGGGGHMGGGGMGGGGFHMGGGVRMGGMSHFGGGFRNFGAPHFRSPVLSHRVAFFPRHRFFVRHHPRFFANIAFVGNSC